MSLQPYFLAQQTVRGSSKFWELCALLHAHASVVHSHSWTQKSVSSGQRYSSQEFGFSCAVQDFWRALSPTVVHSSGDAAAGCVQGLLIDYPLSSCAAKVLDGNFENQAGIVRSGWDVMERLPNSSCHNLPALALPVPLALGISCRAWSRVMFPWSKAYWCRALFQNFPPPDVIAAWKAEKRSIEQNYLNKLLEN